MILKRDKITIFIAKFFLESFLIDFNDLKKFVYSKSILIFNIIMKKILITIRKSFSQNVAKKNEISNIVFQRNLSIL